jgi:hypothetical protein
MKQVHDDPNAARGDWDGIKELAKDDLIKVDGLILVHAPPTRTTPKCAWRRSWNALTSAWPGSRRCPAAMRPRTG